MATSYHALQDDKQGDSNERHRKFILAMGLVFLTMLACITWGWRKKDVLSKDVLRKGVLKKDVEAPPPYLTDSYSRERWVTCTTTKSQCPLELLDNPRDSCINSASAKRVLLTADGLSSPHVRESFQRVLQSAVETRTSGRNPADKSMVVVLDAAYGAYGASGLFPFCDMRSAELKFLGASDVICVVLDPAAREDIWRTGQEEGGHSRKFGDAMMSLNDDYLFEELSRAIVIFVDYGSILILLQNFRRRLNLTGSHSHESFGDLVRSRVNDNADALAYVGVSSGSSIAGETVLEYSPSQLGTEFGKINPSVLQSLGGDVSGLGLVKNCSFYPHATQQDESWLDRAARTSHTGIMTIPNCQPVAYTGSNLGRMSRICP